MPKCVTPCQMSSFRINHRHRREEPYVWQDTGVAKILRNEFVYDLVMWHTNIYFSINDIWIRQLSIIWDITQISKLSIVTNTPINFSHIWQDIHQSNFISVFESMTRKMTYRERSALRAADTNSNTCSFLRFIGRKTSLCLQSATTTSALPPGWVWWDRSDVLWINQTGEKNMLVKRQF